MVERSALRYDCAEVGTSCRLWFDVQQSRVEDDGENGGDASDEVLGCQASREVVARILSNFTLGFKVL